MKKVLFVLSYSHLGGAETRAVDLAINLKNDCLPFFIIYGKREGAVQKLLSENNIFYLERNAFNWKSSFKQFDVLYRLFKEFFFIIKTYYYYRPTSVISFCADANILVSCSNIFINNERTYWCQEDDFIQWRWKRLFLFSIRNSKKVIAVSDFIKNQIIIKSNLKENKIITVNNSIDISHLEVNKVKSTVIRLSIIGHINSLKNQGLAIRNIQKMFEGDLITKFELNLYGLISDKIYWASINNDAKWLNYKGYKNKNYIYNNSDIVIITSTSEASPLVCLESDYFNLPLLCSDIPSLTSISNENVVFFKSNDDDDFKKGLVNILNLFLNAPISTNKRKIYKKEYENYVNSYCKLLISETR